MQYIAYTRCSTEDQREKGHSHEYQIEGIRKSGAVVVGNLQEVAHFQDTVTGTRFDNRQNGLDAAFKMLERHPGKVQYLFVYRWDRLGRDVGDCFACIKRFSKVGVTVNCPDEWVEYSDPSWPLLLSVKFGMAQSESMRISDRTRDGIHAANKAGIWTNRPPVGYLKGQPIKHEGKERRICEIDPLKGPIVRECFELYAQGVTKAELQEKYMGLLGIAKSQFQRMFHLSFYAGMIEVKPHRGQSGQTVQGLHQALINRELFQKCQDVKAITGGTTLGMTWTNGSVSQVGEYFLKGVLKCPITWRNMTAYKSTGKSGKRFAYYANPKTRKGQIIPVEAAHQIVFSAISGMKINNEEEAEIRAEIERQVSERTQSAKAKAEESRRTIGKLKDRIAKVSVDYADGQINAADYRELKARFDISLLNAEQQAIEAEAMAAENDDIIFRALNLLSGIDTLFMAASGQFRQKILNALFPEGFEIDQKTRKVRTPCVNSIIFAMCSKSILSGQLEIKYEGAVLAKPVGGGQADNYRTHLALIEGLFAA